MPVNHMEAGAMIHAAMGRALALGIQVSVVVVDEGGVMVAAGRMDGASAVSVAAAEAKAANCAVGRRDGSAFVALFREKPETIAFLERILPRPISPGLGGLMVSRAGRFAGAVGVSGGTGPQDEECAREALRALDEHGDR